MSAPVALSPERLHAANASHNKRFVWLNVWTKHTDTRLLDMEKVAEATFFVCHSVPALSPSPTALSTSMNRRSTLPDRPTSRFFCEKYHKRLALLAMYLCRIRLYYIGNSFIGQER